MIAKGTLHPGFAWCDWKLAEAQLSHFDRICMTYDLNYKLFLEAKVIPIYDTFKQIVWMAVQRVGSMDYFRIQFNDDRSTYGSCLLSLTYYRGMFSHSGTEDVYVGVRH